MKSNIIHSKTIFRYIEVFLFSLFVFVTTENAIGQITINKTVVPSGICNQFNVNITITGTSYLTPLDAILVIDRSGSMADGSPSSMSHAKTAAINFVRKVFNPMNNPGNANRIGVVSYSNFASKDIQLSFAADSSLIISKINALVANGSTNIADAFYQASKEMKSRGRTNCDVLRSIILLTDGVSNMGSTYNAVNDQYDGNCTNTPVTANACTNSAYLRGQESWTFTVNGVTYTNNVYTVGLFGGISGSTQTLAANVLNSAENSGFYQTESAADLNGIYNQIFGQLQWAARAIPGVPMVIDTLQTDLP
jgi:large repetitive protein